MQSKCLPIEKSQGAARRAARLALGMKPLDAPLRIAPAATDGAALDSSVMRARLDERRRERERIARELHDTLLQGMQALVLFVHALSSRLQSDDPLRSMSADALLRADALMAQGRDRIQNLRASGSAVDLVQSLADAWRDLEGDRGFKVLVEGRSRKLEPDVGDEIALIGREALNNALLHSRAQAIEVHVVFGDDALRLCVRDDGVGLGKDALVTDPPAGHWGLLGMRERARSLSARLTLWSAPGAGTEIELVVPASSAYAEHCPAASRRGMLTASDPRTSASGPDDVKAGPSSVGLLGAG